MAQPGLLRNHAFEKLAALAIEQGEAEIGGTLPQPTKDVVALLGIIGGEEYY